MTDYVRVRDRVTGHEYTIPARQLDAEAHERLDKDPLGRDGLPRAPKYRVTLGNAPAPSAAYSRPGITRTAPPRTPDPVAPDLATLLGGPDTDDGQSAESDKENG